MQRRGLIDGSGEAGEMREWAGVGGEEKKLRVRGREIPGRLSLIINK